MLHCGIVGLPLSGKSTVFNVITRAGAEVKPYPGGKIDPNRAVVSVPDARFDKLSAAHNPKKVIPAQVEFVDIAGLSRGASRGEGLGNAFLSFVADADALIHVIRCFENHSVPHPEGNVDPVRDWDILETELVFRDLAVVENRLEKLSSKKKLSADEEMEKSLLGRCSDWLFDERPLHGMEMSETERRLIRGFSFLTLKRRIIALNLDETQRSLDDIPSASALKKRIESSGDVSMEIYGRLEMDLLELDDEDAAEFTQELNIERPGRERLISSAYSALGLISFFTFTLDEARAWTIRDGDDALAAAGAIHSDFARGFIRAQVVGFDDYEKHGFSYSNCRDEGVLRLEGKDYKVRDGDVIEIRFNI